MALKRSSTAVWHGTGPKGSGTISMQSGAFKDQPYSVNSRFSPRTARPARTPRS